MSNDIIVQCGCSVYQLPKYILHLEFNTIIVCIIQNCV